MEKAGSTPKYIKLNENIEKWTGIFYFLIVQMTVPVIFIPNLIITFYLYFATNLEGEAFILPFLIWCVCHFIITMEN